MYLPSLYLPAYTYRFEILLVKGKMLESVELSNPKPFRTLYSSSLDLLHKYSPLAKVEWIYPTWDK